MIILIGGTSFIGVYTVEELLKRNCNVIVTGRNNKFKSHYEALGVEYVNLDITNKEDFKKLPTQDIEGVILLGGLLPANAPVNLNETENARDYFEVNTIGTINVLEYCRENNIKRVISTTSYADVYNSWEKNKAISEEEPRGFSYEGDHAAYVISKNAATDIMEYYNQQHGMANAVFRLPPVYGVGPHGYLYINGKYTKSGLQIFIDKSINGEEIIVFGDRELSRDVVYVKDVASAFYLALKSDQTSGLYNMTSGTAITLEKQVEIITEVFKKSEKGKSYIKYDPTTKNNTPSYLFSIEKAKADFGYEPKYADFEVMMQDYKKEYEAEKFKNLFQY
ncbi:nucleoside-diphosphate sugar epimerase [Priestia megaterium]|uniref:NAD-dependent epimerase/dehydratase family protein n=1 Tax=Priestia megaterium TaxID=1404 RepID=UPI000BF6000C|nr:NAD(P)-dependent oxidoreductase [Priestia megaterium]PEU72431.1 nucleoside-diphosphate sugar epimerase [Priestia megaterium]